MNKSISILGCGWLGEPLAQQLMKQGYFIKGSTTSESKIKGFNSLGISPYLISLDSIESMDITFLDSEVLIIMLPSKNVIGFKNLISEIEKSNIEKVLFISSTSVYKDSNKKVTEETPVEFSELATIEKLFAENKKFKTTIIRFAGLFGYERNPGNFFAANRKISNPDGFVNMIHRDDCINIIEIIIKKNVWSEVFNACADTHPTRREFYTKFVTDLGREAPNFEDSKPVSYKIISNQKLKSKLMYEFIVSDILSLNDIK